MNEKVGKCIIQKYKTGLNVVSAEEVAGWGEPTAVTLRLKGTHEFLPIEFTVEEIKNASNVVTKYAIWHKYTPAEGTEFDQVSIFYVKDNNA